MKKSFFIFAIAILIMATACESNKTNKLITLPVPAREAGQTDMIQFSCNPLPVVRIGFIGLGMRGSDAVLRMMAIEGTEIIAICDLEPYNIQEVQKSIISTGRPAAAEYSGEDGWKKLCERNDIDLVYICTDWLNHAQMAVYAMEQGKHAATEVPAAVTVAECWQLVNTAEKTRRHCMMLENCCYDDFELATLNMTQAGLFGEIVHVEGAYIHDLRSLCFNDRLLDPESATSENVQITGYWNHWRKNYHAAHTGNPYPTHGLGPICQILDIHRGDKMDYLVSISSNQFGMTEYAKERYGENSSEAKQEYALGDMNTTIVKTQKGKTIMIQHDVTSPRPYNRLHTVSGTKGFAQKFPSYQIALEPNAHKALSKTEMDSLLAVYEHSFYKEAGKTAAELGNIAHGGMDYIMDYRLIYCLRNGLPLDQNVYDAAAWSSIIELSEISVRNNGAPVAIPDFTRGAWDKIKGLKFAE